MPIFSSAHLDTVQRSRNQQKKPEFASFLAQSQCRRISAYEAICVIGRGAFGEVCLVRSKVSGELFALKAMKKSRITSFDQLAHLLLERQLLEKNCSQWIVGFYEAFQDERFLYLVMEYVPGGDLMELLIHRGIFSPEMVRFYVAECVLALQAVHDQGYIHRDLKPDNILIDRNGNIRLVDFGLCAQSCSGGVQKETLTSLPTIRTVLSLWSHQQNQSQNSAAGTPAYASPEVLQRKAFDSASDWWSLGVVMYEMLFGRLPFDDKDGEVSCIDKIISWDRYLRVPFCDFETRDLINQWLCDSPNRLGCQPHDIIRIKAHPYFSSIDWEALQERRLPAPFIPTLESETDTRYFTTFDQFSSNDVHRLLGSPDLNSSLDSQQKDPNLELYGKALFSHFNSADPSQ